MQELQVINVQMRIITDENVEHFMDMSYSKNINKILKMDDDADLTNMIDTYVKNTLSKKNSTQTTAFVPKVIDQFIDTVKETIADVETELIGETGSPRETGSPGETGTLGETGSQGLGEEEVKIIPNNEVLENGVVTENGLEEVSSNISFEDATNFGNPELNMIYAKLTPDERVHLQGLSKEDTIQILQVLLDKQKSSQNILKVAEEKPEEEKKEKENSDKEETTKKFIINN
jgi:hypothetical protein